MLIDMKYYNLDNFKKKDLYEWDEIIGIIENLEEDKKALEIELENLKNDIEDNYKRIDVADQYGISNYDFI